MDEIGKELEALKEAVHSLEKTQARFDERTLNTYYLMEKLERHQANQNGYIKDNFINTQRNTVWRKVIVATLTLIVGWIAKLHNLW